MLLRTQSGSAVVRAELKWIAAQSKEYINRQWQSQYVVRRNSNQFITPLCLRKFASLFYRMPAQQWLQQQ